ncbi:hypothetical protein [Myxococcus qinghaiensis]|uniref:hypothetical protein n=1 Tax=Myxococcus qinghaiensis TaxID=2906758 RepID=UPI0020A6F7B2|nr:hypothetical protein [Myxococcus qinghaiensis]MCP3166014.1 hypothetical protein [Myxococcus qinghaiensis]
MDGGLAIFGFGLFLLSIASLYARTAYGVAIGLLAMALVSMGMAFSESKKLREISLGLSLGLLALATVAVATGTVWWLSLGTFLFAVAFGVLWAEYRFAFFEHVRQEDLPPRRPHHARRMNVHWPWHRRRSAP